MEQTHPSITADGGAFAAWHRKYDWQTDGEYAATIARARRSAAAKAASLEQLGRLLGALDVPAPTVDGYGPDDWTARWYVDDLDGARAVRRAIGSPNGGTWQKVTKNGSLSVELVVDRLRLIVAVTSTTCEAVVVGTETADVAVEVCPDCDADLDRRDGAVTECSAGCGFVRRPVKRVTRTVERDVVEWRCPDINGSSGDAEVDG